MNLHPNLYTFPKSKKGKTPTVYIAGPMSGKPSYNIFEFERAAELLAEKGWVAVTPFEANNRVWRKHYGRDFDPYTDTCEWYDPIMNEMFAEDVEVMTAADAVALMDGWENSIGAALEAAIAQRIGKLVYRMSDGELLTDYVDLLIPGKGPQRPDRAPKDTRTVLEEAQSLVHGPRQAAYGHPYDDYSRTGKMWEAILGLPNGTITPRLACLMMVAVKLSRETNVHKRDNLTDAAGYVECAHLCVQEAERRQEAA